MLELPMQELLILEWNLIVKFVPLYSVAMRQPIITTTKAPFVLAPVHNIIGIKSRPQTPRGIELVSVHEEMPKEMNKVFVD
jgi:hypothetical protein